MGTRKNRVFPREQEYHRAYLDSLPMSEHHQPVKTVAPSVGVERRPAAVRVNSNRDMFGGHGLFEDLMPIGCSMALFGLLPITLRPPRVSFHPLKSTLVYCLAWLVLVLWSGHRMLSARASLLTGGRDLSMQTTFVSVLCFSHSGGMLLLPLLWIEARHLNRNEDLCASLMASFGDARRHCRWARVVSWTTVLFGTVLSPIMVVLWLGVVGAEGSDWTHAFICNQVIVLLFELGALFSCLFHCVKTFALDFGHSLSQELSLAYPSARRVAAHRRAWLELRDITKGLVALPLTALGLFIFVLISFTLQTYLTLVCILEHQAWLGALIFTMAFWFMSILLLFCDAVHRAVSVVINSCLQPLESFSSSAVGVAAMEEINIFREVVSSSTIVVTAGGYWCIGRNTMTSVLAASAGYLIILIQFRHTEFSSDDFRNLSSVESTTAVSLVPQ